MAAGLGRTSGEGRISAGGGVQTGTDWFPAASLFHVVLGFDLRSGSFTPFVERWDPSVN